MREVNKSFAENKNNLLETTISVHDISRGPGPNKMDEQDLVSVFVDNSFLKTKLNKEQVDYMVGYSKNFENPKEKEDWNFGKMARFASNL